MFHFKRSFEGEKLQLQELNQRLGQYLSRAKMLEQENARLVAEINTIRNNRCTEWESTRMAELREMRSLVEQLCLEQSRAEMEREKLRRELHLIQTLRSEESTLTKDLTGELKGCDKQLRCALQTNSALEERLLHLQDQCALLHEAHGSEVARIRSQVHTRRLPAVTQPYHGPPEFTTQEVHDYALSLSQSWMETFEVYRQQVEEMEGSIKADQARLEDLRREKVGYASELNKLREEMEKHTHTQLKLEEHLMDMQEKFRKDVIQYQMIIEELEQEHMFLANTISEKLKDHHDLLQVKMGLGMEVAAYRALLEDEGKRSQMRSDQYSREKVIDIKVPVHPYTPRGSVMTSYPDARRNLIGYDVRNKQPISSMRTSTVSSQFDSHKATRFLPITISNHAQQSPVERRDMIAFTKAKQGSGPQSATKPDVSTGKTSKEQKEDVMDEQRVINKVVSKSPPRSSPDLLQTQLQNKFPSAVEIKSVRVVAPPMMSLNTYEKTPQKVVVDERKDERREAGQAKAKEQSDAPPYIQSKDTNQEYVRDLEDYGDVGPNIFADEEKVLDLASTEDKAFDATSTEDKAFDAASTEDKAFDAASTEDKAFDAASTEDKAFDAASTEDKAFDAASTEDKAFDAASMEEIALDAASTEEIVLDALSTEEIALDAASTEEIALDAASTEEIALDAASTEEIALDAASTEEIALDAASTEEIALDAASTEEIALDAASTEEIALDAASTEEIALDAASTEEIALDAASTEEIALDAASTEEIALDAASTEEKALDAASTEEKALDAAPTEEKALDSPPTEEKALDSPPTEEKALDSPPTEEKALDTVSIEEIIEKVIKPAGFDTKLSSSADSKITYHVEKTEQEDGTTKTQIVLQSKVEEDLDVSEDLNLEELLSKGVHKVSLEDIQGTPTECMIQNLLRLGLENESLENKSVKVEIIEAPVESHCDEGIDEAVIEEIVEDKSKPYFQTSTFFHIEEPENEPQSAKHENTETVKASEYEKSGFVQVQEVSRDESPPDYSQGQETQEYFVSTPEDNMSGSEEGGGFMSYRHYGVVEDLSDERYYQEEDLPTNRMYLEEEENNKESPEYVQRDTTGISEPIFEEEVHVSPAMQKSMLEILKEESLDPREQLKEALEQLESTVSGALKEELVSFTKPGQSPENLSVNIQKVQQSPDNGTVTFVAELNISQSLEDSGLMQNKADDLTPEQVMVALQSSSSDPHQEHSSVPSGEYTFSLSSEEFQKEEMPLTTSKEKESLCSGSEISKTEKVIKLGCKERSFTFQMDVNNSASATDIEVMDSHNQKDNGVNTQEFLQTQKADPSLKVYQEKKIATVYLESPQKD